MSKVESHLRRNDSGFFNNVEYMLELDHIWGLKWLDRNDVSLELFWKVNDEVF